MRLTYIPARFNASGHHKTAKNRTSNLLFNILAFLLITAGLALIGVGFTEMSAPISILKSEQISLDPVNLFEYSLRTTLRMFIALVFSLIFSLFLPDLRYHSHVWDFLVLSKLLVKLSSAV